MTKNGKKNLGPSSILGQKSNARKHNAESYAVRMQSSAILQPAIKRPSIAT